MTELAFLYRLENKVKEQIKSQRVAFLLGAGSSYLDGKGYPLASSLWETIKNGVPMVERAEIQAKLDGGAGGIEPALDLLDKGGVNETKHRHLVTDAIASHFRDIEPPLEIHCDFIQRIVAKPGRGATIFSLNYDPLMERAAEHKRIRLIDGFWGTEHAYFDSALFQQDSYLISKGHKGPQGRLITGIIRLIKLHGSIGWYDCPNKGIRRCSFTAEIPPNTKRLMIPPQHRKATDTMMLPYANLWSEFRGMLRHGPNLVNRIVALGYGMCDEHVNAVIDNGLARSDLTLLIFALKLSDESFNRWKGKLNVIIITKDRCSLYGEIGSGHPSLWSFEQLSKEV